jgi:hypothetical protein
LSKLVLIILAIGMAFSACRKNHIATPEPCLQQTENPDHRSYSSTEIANTSYQGKHCGLIPFSSKHSWVYLDSIFDNGVFVRTELDTLQFTKTYQTQSDGLIWWAPNKSVGLPSKCYANDSTVFSLEDRLFTSHTVFDVKKELYLFTPDSIQFLTSFGDEMATGKAINLAYLISTPAGNFPNCLLFEKYARMYRRDQVYLEPGIGVVKYIHEEAPSGSLIIQTQQISTLVSYNIE